MKTFIRIADNNNLQRILRKNDFREHDVPESSENLVGFDILVCRMANHFNRVKLQ